MERVLRKISSDDREKRRASLLENGIIEGVMKMPVKNAENRSMIEFVSLEEMAPQNVIQCECVSVDFYGFLI